MMVPGTMAGEAVVCCGDGGIELGQRHVITPNLLCLKLIYGVSWETPKYVFTDVMFPSLYCEWRRPGVYSTSP